MEVFRVLLGRLTVITRTTSRWKIFFVCILCDVFSIFTSFLAVPAFAQSMTYECDFIFDALMMMVLAYQFFSIFRFLAILGHFMYGKRFWRWVKRQSCCACLNTIEYE